METEGLLSADRLPASQQRVLRHWRSEPQKQTADRPLSGQVPTQLEPWPETLGVRRASINNFGYGGSNAHVIMEEYNSFVASSVNSLPLSNHTNSNGYSRVNGISNGYTNGTNGHPNGHGHIDGDSAARSRVFVISAKDERATQAMAENLRDHILTAQCGVKEERTFLDNLAYTLGHRRSQFPWLSTIAGNSIADLVKAIDSGKAKPVKRGTSPRLGFVYTGQGAQWWAMGRELVEVYPVFKTALLDCNSHLKRLGAQWSMIGM